jgi:hypothetical protein
MSNVIVQTSLSQARSALRSNRGSVMLETALVIPVLIGVGAILLSAFAVGMSSLALGDTARECARALARGDDVARVRQLAEQMSPRAHITFDEQSDRIVVHLQQDVSIPLLLGRTVSIDRAATTAREAW